jgi:hypothetical protein
LSVPPALAAGLVADLRASVISKDNIPLATGLTDGAIIGETCTWVTFREVKRKSYIHYSYTFCR